MSKKTYERRVQQLVKELADHPHKDELLCIAFAQINDDRYIC